MHRRRHRYGHLAIRDRDLAADTHDRIGRRLLFRESLQLYEITGKLRICDEYRTGVFCDLDSLANVIAMPVCEKYVIHLPQIRERVLAVLCVWIQLIR